MGRFVDLTGKTFDSLTVVRRLENDKNKNARWECKCECGNIVLCYGDNLRRNHTRSCGCQKGDMITKRKTRHGHTLNGVSPEYRAYVNMTNRCTRPNNTHYKYYGGRGIKICERWLQSFDNFFEDMGKRPSPKHSLDRFPDQDGDYEKTNCRWATRKQQAENKSNNVWYEYGGVKKTQTEWAIFFGVVNSAIVWHLMRGRDFKYVYEWYTKKRLR